MQITQFDELARYIERLRADPDEVTALFSDLLIGVTHFFRDSEAFAALEKLMIPRLFQNGGATDTLRVWVPGCSTGEEVYSIAILMREHMDYFAVHRSCKSLPPISTRGRSPWRATALIRMPCCRASRSGTLTGSSVGKRGATPSPRKSGTSAFFRPPQCDSVIRRFRVLISCRNLLIYLGSDFQARVIPAFHFALKPGGFLFLGSSHWAGVPDITWQAAINELSYLRRRRGPNERPMQRASRSTVEF